MSGHSKWSQIKRQKGVTDTKRGAVFTKLAKAITIAVSQGGGVTDPNANFKLRLAVDRARSYNMPKDNIERAIQRAKAKDANSMEEALYEGFGPGGTAMIIEAVTDNKLRTTSEVKNVIEKNGGSLGAPGSVAYQFEQKGLISIEKDNKTLDDIFMIAVDKGAEDIEDAESTIMVYTAPQDLKKIKDELIENGLVIKEAELVRKPTNLIKIEDRALALKIISFMDKIEEMDDVQKIYSNFDIPDNLLV